MTAEFNSNLSQSQNTNFDSTHSKFYTKCGSGVKLF